jgi:nucleotide-binding universal stress UspA family protein
MNERNTYEAFVIKRKSFEYEQEVRAVTLLPVPYSLETVLGKVAMLREQMNIEIIIIEAKGRSGIKKLLVGSLTLAVIKQAHC